jgi:hypothetical protein
MIDQYSLGVALIVQLNKIRSMIAWAKMSELFLIENIFGHKSTEFGHIL